MSKSIVIRASLNILSLESLIAIGDQCATLRLSGRESRNHYFPRSKTETSLFRAYSELEIMSIELADGPLPYEVAITLHLPNDLRDQDGKAILDTTAEGKLLIELGLLEMGVPEHELDELEYVARA